MRGALDDLASPVPLAATLPAVYGGDALTQDLCAGLDGLLGPVVATLDSLSAYLDPQLTPEDMLDWLAGWLGLVFTGSETEERKRDLVSAGAEIMRWRGTVRGILDAIRAVFEVDPEVQDSGATIASADAESPAPGDGTFRVEIAIRASGVPVDIRRLDAVVAAVKPAHVRHTVRILDEQEAT
ncbi:phage tail protein [Rhodococcus aetherivorans]|uniref:phage tail protein n=1 Tax=Rhodococcus aetherivorans TaxID=191292 RepID=UPI0036C1E591